MNLLNKITGNPHYVFLLDSIGALVSALLLVLLIGPYQHIFGLPRSIVGSLTIPAFAFAFYSLSCFLLKPKNWKLYLWLIAIANFIYCCVTLTIMLQQQKSLTTVGILYFSAEILVILAVISIEIATIRRHSKSTISK